jgi:hypothetical protein
MAPGHMLANKQEMWQGQVVGVLLLVLLQF